MYELIYYFTSGLFLTESFSVNKKSIIHNENNFFNTSIQENLNMIGQVEKPVVNLSNTNIKSEIIFGVSVILTTISASVHIKITTAYHISLQASNPANTEMMIFDGTYDKNNNVFISKELDVLKKNEEISFSLYLIVLKQSSTPPTYVLTGVAYADEKKTEKVVSTTIDVVSGEPKIIEKKENLDYEISFKDNMNPEVPGNLEFEMIQGMYVANIDFTITFTNKKEKLEEIYLRFFFSSKMEEANVIYKIADTNVQCSEIFPENVSQESLSNNISATPNASNAFFVFCEEKVIQANKNMNYRIRGLVSSVKPLKIGTKYILGLQAVILNKIGNNPYGHTLLSSNRATKTTVDPNSMTTESNKGSSPAKKELSVICIAGIIIGLFLILGLIVGITLFTLKKKNIIYKLRK